MVKRLSVGSITIKELLILLIFLAASCNGSRQSLIGSWVQPVPGQPDEIQGIKIASDGDASSINMSTLVYEKWEVANGLLILKGKSIGNEQTILFTDTLVIEKLSADSLILKRGNVQLIYSRR